ncbi:amidohydrolase family protein [Nocardia mexicana]|uniref:Imidazolonepropionase-like amidohydrolase n=1 Tax=Nocardia mexicana TaxID=279262 RepID=A0A370GF98_9NOCA|nr:amidohydrolase family protein [Nocardia mexicana]RDI42482.1 imidazolonepropionase-like amidohydrolase [Nocardia mexicana]
MSSPIDRRRFLGTTITAAGVLAAAGCGALGDAAPAQPKHRTLIRGARIFDGERIRPATPVMIVGDTIADDDGGPADTVIDGAGKTLLPGLIDAHTHVFDGSLRQALTHGVTTELDMFCLPTVLPEQRRLAATRDDVADIRSAATLATAPGGHPTQLISALAGAGVPGVTAETTIDTIDSPAGARAFVAARIAEGADYLKIVVDDGAVHRARFPVPDTDTLTALSDAAHEAGLLVIAHAVTAREAETALAVGADGLAHVWSDLCPGDPASRRLAERVRASGVFVVTTLAYFETITQQREPVTGCAAPGHEDNAMDAARSLREAGVPLLAGTDATPFAPAHGAAMHRELVLLREAGLDPEAALAAATSVPARHFGLADRGRIAPGLRADLLLIDGDPIRDITATERISEIWRRGVRLAR